MECAPDGGQVVGWELTRAAGLSKDGSHGQAPHLQHRQQHSVIEQVAASPPVPALRADEIKEVEMLNSTKSGVPEKDKNAAANAAEVMGGDGAAA